MRPDSGPVSSRRSRLGLKCRAIQRVGRNRCFAVLAALCAWPTTSGCAEEGVGTRPGGLNGAPLATEGFLETAFGLFVVLATIVALAWAARRFGRFPVAGKGLVNVLGGITLGSRERVVVVQVEDARLVLGVAPGRIETLYVLGPSEDAKPPFVKALETEMPESMR